MKKSPRPKKNPAAAGFVGLSASEGGVRHLAALLGNLRYLDGYICASSGGAVSRPIGFAVGFSESMDPGSA
jgi:hypothetical protein